jgi:hypothetical protein
MNKHLVQGKFGCESIFFHLCCVNISHPKAEHQLRTYVNARLRHTTAEPEVQQWILVYVVN